MMATLSLNPRLFQAWEFCLSSQGCSFVCPFQSGTPVAVFSVQMTILPKSLPCESVFATCSAMGSLFSVHAQSCVNKQKSLAVPLV